MINPICVQHNEARKKENNKTWVFSVKLHFKDLKLCNWSLNCMLSLYNKFQTSSTPPLNRFWWGFLFFLFLLWQGSARPDLEHWDRDQYWKCLSLNNETKTETENVWVSITRPKLRLKMSKSQLQDRDWNVQASMTRPIPRLKKCESQWWDRDCKCVSLNDETKTETEKSESQCQDQDWKNLSVRNKTGQKMSIPRLHQDSPLEGRGMIFAP